VDDNPPLSFFLSKTRVSGFCALLFLCCFSVVLLRTETEKLKNGAKENFWRKIKKKKNFLKTQLLPFHKLEDQ